MLDIKHRPKRFSDIIGNSGIVRALRARSADGSLHGRSLMLAGPKGCGKTSTARIIARAASCSFVQDGEPCNECPTCIGCVNETLSGLDEFDAASHGSVDRIRSMVDDLEYGNVDGIRPMLILDEAQRLGPAAQDSMLKSMEERRLTVILCTTEPNKIRPALRDRVEEYSLRPPDEADAVAWIESICLSEKIPFEPDALRDVVRSCGCFPRTCLNSVWSLHKSGGITADSVRDFFRYKQVESVASVLRDVDSNPAGALRELDHVLSSESPSWVRETIIRLVSSAMRASVGAKARDGYPTWFYGSRSRDGWSSLVRSLLVCDRPSASDIEFAIISTSGNLPTMVVPTQPQPQPQPQPQKLPEPPRLVETPPVSCVAPKSLKLDDIVFRSDERLTTLDDKMEPSRGPGTPVSENHGPKVELDPSKVPMSEQEFARAFVERVKQT